MAGVVFHFRDTLSRQGPGSSSGVPAKGGCARKPGALRRLVVAED